jgi:hypothetical protein
MSGKSMPVGIKFFTMLAKSIARETLAIEEDEIFQFKKDKQKCLDEKIQRQKDIVSNHSNKIYSKERRNTGKAPDDSTGGFSVPKLRGQGLSCDAKPKFAGVLSNWSIKLPLPMVGQRHQMSLGVNLGSRGLDGDNWSTPSDRVIPKVENNQSGKKNSLVLIKKDTNQRKYSMNFLASARGLPRKTVKARHIFDGRGFMEEKCEIGEGSEDNSNVDMDVMMVRKKSRFASNVPGLELMGLTVDSL